MMIENLKTDAEKLAARAEELPAFSGIKLLNVKRNLAHILELIGRELIFSEYTRHDISHIDRMLMMLDWLIPASTKPVMTPADWLMLVLSIYFHDLGMLVTKQEYDLRNKSGFPEYRDNYLFAGEHGEDYRAKVGKMNPESAERFLYQEFVRHKHAERIKAWIMGISREQLGISNAAVTEVDGLLAPLDFSFRQDLAAVCESHHLEDLDDFKKYSVRQPYGNSDAETANLQYAAALMRTTDLLHITKDRTPSVSFRLINPTDPISQEEWAKQMVVTNVRPQVAYDAEGILDENAPRDTIEVHARFTQQDGFFALTSYLAYAEEQIRKTYDWVKTANRTQASKHEFPWRKIDDSHIQTFGFLRQTFEFSLDQAKILKLLTGHTLYNDTQVVLRELVQNALDAVRLQQFINKKSDAAEEPGFVKIHWDSDERILSVEDNGTGMTQEIVEHNLLTVGASRYEDPEFKKTHPGFSAISRFGIGILTTFMISDNVEIITCHPDENEARQLSLRSVHGKYLIRLLDKDVDEYAKRLAPHGTLIRLKVRHSVEMPDVIETARRWIVVPSCQITVSIDGEPPVKIGAASPREALIQALKDAGISVSAGTAPPINGSVRVKEEEKDGVRVAYAVEWSEYFREWTFLSMYRRYETEGIGNSIVGTCIEGIRVEFETPGFDTIRFFAIANASGPNAPKTNVARSGLEMTPERNALLDAIYYIYCRHIKNEIEELHTKRSFSLTWAVKESKYLLSPLRVTEGHDFGKALNRELLMNNINELPILIVEHNSLRQAVSPSQVRQESSFWTIHCESFRFAEAFIKELPGQVSLSNLVSAARISGFGLPDAPVLSIGDYIDSLSGEMVFEGKEVSSIKVYREQRRIDLEWADRTTPPRWLTVPGYIRSPSEARRIASGDYLSEDISDEFNLRIAKPGLNITGASDEIAVKTSNLIYILPDSVLSEYLIGWLNLLNENQTYDMSKAVYLVFDLVADLLNGDASTPLNEEDVAENFNDNGSTQAINNIIQIDRLCKVLNSVTWKIFDPSVWRRRNPNAPAYWADNDEF
ncbi:MAG TPA: ATP-binding protein [Pyrinomonadaceae bacterium]|jgi:hypothetical protein|nr:ATP-binding protein [Pyrinomonadaceae bacterium]